MDAIEVLNQHINMLKTAVGGYASGVGYLQGLIDARLSMGRTAMVEGELSTFHPATLAGYRAAAERIFAPIGPATNYLDTLIESHGADAAFAHDELHVAYALGCIASSLSAPELTISSLDETLQLPEASV